MNQYTSLCKALNQRELPHEFFEDCLDSLRFRICELMDGYPPSCEMVIGPSRVGKTMLIDSIARQFPAVVKDGVRQVPVLVVKLTHGISPKQLPRCVLTDLGAPVPSSMASNALMYERMARQLRLAGTRVILFDEVGHIVDIGSKLAPRAAGDWFKQVIDQLSISVVLFGILPVERLLKSNEQLRYRTGAVTRFYPYAWAVPAEQRHFVACIRTYVKLFEQAGCRFTFEFEALVHNTYLISGGLIGIVAKFMVRLAHNVKSKNDNEITWQDCAKALERIETIWESGKENPGFQEMLVAPIRLNEAYSLVMEDARARHRKSV